MIGDFLKFLIGLFTSQLPKTERGWSIYEKITAAIAITWLILSIAFMVLVAFFKNAIFPRGFY